MMKRTMTTMRAIPASSSRLIPDLLGSSTCKSSGGRPPPEWAPPPERTQAAPFLQILSPQTLRVFHLSELSAILSEPMTRKKLTPSLDGRSRPAASRDARTSGGALPPDCLRIKHHWIAFPLLRHGI